MTELATPPVEAGTGVKRISHWIGGRTVAGESGRSGVVFNPATGRQSGAGRLRHGRGGRQGRPGGEGGVPGVARGLARAARGDLLPHPRAGGGAARGGGEAPHRRARQGALRCARRGDARARGDRVLLRHPDAAEERVLGAGVDGDRRLLDPAAARRRRRHHAVQLPGDGAHVDVGARARVRQHVRPQAVGEGPVRVAVDGGAAQGGGRAGRRLQRRHGRQGRRRRGAPASGHRGRVVRRLDADRALRLRDRDVDRQAVPGTRRREEPHDRAAGRRHRHGCGRRRVRRVRLRRRALHGHLAGGRRRRRRRAADRGDQGADPEGEGRRRDGSVVGDGARS